ncbi:crotonase/enoyl-CoA hydratase family protein [Rhodococcus sp. NPDC127530]|uniref:crotonase/enoyl-CoA hydratase family protein n=1 Tax=unclassified Rhodococcus (in: high G+C Gram-positive bacteria) TaxID=192944 RepID=UPI0036280C11
MTTNTNSAPPSQGEDLGGVTVEKRGGIFLIGLDRPTKRNALSPKIFRDIAEAYRKYEADDTLRCAVLYGHGAAFSAGADLTLLKDASDRGELEYTDEEYDPFQLSGKTLSKPVVSAVHGMCFAGGMELALAGDIILAAEGTVLGQPETTRGLFAFGGGVVRWPQRVGWGNAQRYLLTGELLSASEALRIGLIQEVVPPEKLTERAVEIATMIAAAAPQGVRATLAVGRKAFYDNPRDAIEDLLERRPVILQTEDAAEGVVSFIERRAGNYTGS